MASGTLGILATATRGPLRKLANPKNLSSSRFYSVLWCRKPERGLGFFGRRSTWSGDSNIVRSSYPEFEPPDMPFHEFIFENVGRWENKVALECSASGKTWTYKQLMKYSKNVASALQKKFNLKKGDVQVAVLPNCPEYPAVYLSGSMTGVVTTTVNPVYTSAEISLQLKTVRPKIVYTVPDTYTKCVEALRMINAKIPVVVVKNVPVAEIPSGAVSFSELAEGSGDLSPVVFDVNDDLVLPFSSGTSGLPKGVQLTHRNIVSNLIQFAMGNELKANPSKETNQSTILGVLPMFHIYGMNMVTFDCLRDGARLVTLPRFEPKLFMDSIATKKTEILYLVPPLIFFLCSPMIESKHLQYVQHVVLGAAPVGKSDIEKFFEKAKHVEVSQGYGMTETSPVITMSHKKRFHKLSSAGHPTPSTVIKVVNVTNGKILPRGSRGEICVKGPQVMKGYFERPQDTEDAFDSEGYLKTGDIGYYDEDDDFYIVDRIKELIKVKGFQVAPAELEEHLRNHPKISDAGVIGVDHPEHGQVPMAFVVVKDGASLEEEEVKNYFKERLSSYKHLAGGVRFLKQIPKSSAGKILRRDLRKLQGS